MENGSGFYTLKGYSLNENEKLTSSMEDYLEMICRILQKNEVVRIRGTGRESACQTILCFKNGE